MHRRACRVPCQEQESPTCAPDFVAFVQTPARAGGEVGTPVSSFPIPRLGGMFSFFLYSFELCDRPWNLAPSKILLVQAGTLIR